MRIVLWLLLALGACGGLDDDDGDTIGPDDTPADLLRLELVASGLKSPVHLAAPPGDPRIFVVERRGRIRIIKDGKLLAEPFLDIVSRVGSGGSEQGLLSVVFHPDFATNRYFFVNYTDRNGDTRVERYTVGPDPDRADPASAKLILTVDQPFANHNGGLIVFGPDGMLYIGMGDGGSGGDPLGHGQNLGTLLGALLRIDVDRGDPYTIPPDNPFAGRADARGEIWAYGLRNPWRFAFDRTAGLLYIADVGQNRWEEINVAPASAGGLNYGWNLMEGNHCFPSDPCDRTGLTPPVLEYSHDEGCSVTGGHVYRGRAIPELVGHYFYADYCRGWIRSFRYTSEGVRDQRTWSIGNVGLITSFGEDSAGELYVLSQDGRVFRFEPQS
ncbi:MAG TPA: PQQ-dependent sugar dehydrogenase [Longimicrobiales bacterium]